MAILGLDRLDQMGTPDQRSAVRRVLKLVLDVFPGTPRSGYYCRLLYDPSLRSGTRIQLNFHMTPWAVATFVFGEAAAIAQTCRFNGDIISPAPRDVLYYDEWTDFQGWVSVAWKEHQLLLDDAWIRRYLTDLPCVGVRADGTQGYIPEMTLVEGVYFPLGPEFCVRPASNIPRESSNLNDITWVKMPGDRPILWTETEQEPPDDAQKPLRGEVIRERKMPPNQHNQEQTLTPGQQIEVHPSLLAYRKLNPFLNPASWSLSDSSWSRYPNSMSYLKPGGGFVVGE